MLKEPGLVCSRDYGFVIADEIQRDLGFLVQLFQGFLGKFSYAGRVGDVFFFLLE